MHDFGKESVMIHAHHIEQSGDCSHEWEGKGGYYTSANQREGI